MNSLRWAGVVLLVLGALGLVYGGFSYTRPKEAVKLGPVAVTVNERHEISVPTWAGTVAVVGGLLLVGLGGRR